GNDAFALSVPSVSSAGNSQFMKHEVLAFMLQVIPLVSGVAAAAEGDTVRRQGLPDPVLSTPWPAPGPTNDAPYVPQPILQGGVVIPLYPPGSPFLKMERVREAEQYNMSKSVPGRISRIVTIHTP